MVSWLVSKQFFSKTALRIFLIFCIKVLTIRARNVHGGFPKKKSGSLIIHENVSKNEEIKLPKKIKNFFGQTVFGF